MFDAFWCSRTIGCTSAHTYAEHRVSFYYATRYPTSLTFVSFSFRPGEQVGRCQRGKHCPLPIYPSSAVPFPRRPNLWVVIVATAPRPLPHEVLCFVSWHNKTLLILALNQQPSTSPPSTQPTTAPRTPSPRRVMAVSKRNVPLVGWWRSRSVIQGRQPRNHKPKPPNQTNQTIETLIFENRNSIVPLQ